FHVYCYGHHRDLHSFPTRRSSDLTRDIKGDTWVASAQSTWLYKPLDTVFNSSFYIRRSCSCSSPTVFSILCIAVTVCGLAVIGVDRKSTRLNSSHVKISYAVFCLK